MIIATDISQLRTALYRLEGTIGVVPTMGNLHDGHLSLFKKARLENDITIATIFINPTQFNNAEDYKRYPRTLKEDTKLAKSSDIDIIFAPSESEMYPNGYNFRVNSSDSLMNILEGKYRSGHFEGVLTVVLKLFIATQADKAYFAEKDYQQLHLVTAMAKSFLLKTEIIPCPIIRLQSGLPLSSRNNNLSPEGLNKANEFASILRSNHNILTAIDILEKMNISVDYLEDHNERRFVAATVDEVRLIDNFSISDIRNS
ncbi:MAG: pantoate--beta-alanine ligase [Francisellaceae bacterium]|jgi:pantoate--beta-alanine ligase